MASVAQESRSVTFPLSDQVAALERAGIRLVDGRALDAALELNREYIEATPHGLISVLAVTDQEGTALTSPGIALISMEGAEDADSYPACFQTIARAAGRSGDLIIEESVFDLYVGETRISYRIGDRAGVSEPDLNGDWYDGMEFGYMCESLARDGEFAAWTIDHDGTWCTWMASQAEADVVWDLLRPTNPDSPL